MQILFLSIEKRCLCMQVYADNAATTKLSDTALQAMLPYLQDTYGNASGVGRTPLQCVPQPPLAIPTRKDSHLIYVLHSEQVAIRHHPPTHRGLMNTLYFAGGTFIHRQ